MYYLGGLHRTMRSNLVTNSRLARQQSPPSSSPHRWGQRIEKHPGVLKRVTRQGVSRLKVGSRWRRELEGIGGKKETKQGPVEGGTLFTAY